MFLILNGMKKFGKYLKIFLRNKINYENLFDFFQYSVYNKYRK